MYELALFAGAGGGILGGTLLGWKTVCAVEKESYCREVLLRRQRNGLLPLFPIWDDVTTFDGKPWCGIVDVISAGFPCQPFSLAGKRKGKEDERNLWPETRRIVSEIRPKYAFLENVPGLLNNEYWGTILGEMAEIGYNVEWCTLSAASCGAPHIRQRLWILAYLTPDTLPDTFSIGGNQCRRSELSEGGEGERNIYSWKSEPRIPRVVDVLANRVDRIRALGNGQVPIVAARAWIELIKRAR